jgi:hypothetical protein
MHVLINVKSLNNISKWQMGFNSAFKGLIVFAVKIKPVICRALIVNIYTSILKALFHERFLPALPEMQWFKCIYFHESALLFPQRCCQGYSTATAGMDRLFPPAVSGSCDAALLSEREALRRVTPFPRAAVTRAAVSGTLLCSHLVRTLIKMSKQSPLDSFDTELFTNELEKLPAFWD